MVIARFVVREGCKELSKDRTLALVAHGRDQRLLCGSGGLAPVRSNRPWSLKNKKKNEAVGVN